MNSSSLNQHPARRSILAAAAALSLALLAGCGADNASQTAKPSANAAPAAAAGPKSARPVVTQAVQPTKALRTASLDAELTSLSSPDISAEVAGKVLRVAVEPGQQVKRGQLLAELDSSDLSLTVLEAQAQVAQVQAQLSEKQRSVQRATELYAKEYVSRSSRDAAQSELEGAQGQLKAAKARAEIAGRGLAKAKVVAPFDGTVMALKTAPGAYARAGDVLLQLWSPQVSVLRMRAPQELAGLLKEGQTVSLTFGRDSASTRIVRVNSALDAASRSFEVLAEVPPELTGRSGLAMGAKVELESRSVLQIPVDALQLAGSEFTVMVVEEGKARRIAVKPGEQSGGLTEIVEGLKPGQVVVVEGASFVDEGQAVAATPVAGAVR